MSPCDARGDAMSRGLRVDGLLVKDHKTLRVPVAVVTAKPPWGSARAATAVRIGRRRHPQLPRPVAAPQARLLEPGALSEGEGGGVAILIGGMHCEGQRSRRVALTQTDAHGARMLHEEGVAVGHQPQRQQSQRDRATCRQIQP